MNAPLSRAVADPAVAGLAVAAGAAVLYAPPAPAIAGGLLLAFVLPGLALLGVLFGRRMLNAVEVVVLTPALSMGVVIVAGLVTHAAGLRIDRLAWTVATVAVTLVAVVAARLIRRPAPLAADADAGAAAPPRPVHEKPPAPTAAQAPPVTDDTVRLPAGAVRLPAGAMAEASTVVMSIVPAMLAEEERRAAAQERARQRRLPRQLLPLILVAAVLAGASWLSFDTSRATHETVVTALSAAPPGPVDAAGNHAVLVSASGLVAGDGPYTVSVTGPGGSGTLRRIVTVTRGGSWSETLSLPGAQRMTVSLYRWGDLTAYRTLFISAVD